MLAPDTLGFVHTILTAVWHVLLPAGPHVIAFLGFGKSKQQKQAQSVADQQLALSNTQGQGLQQRAQAQGDLAATGMQTGLADYTNLAKQFIDPSRFQRNQGAVEDALTQYSGRVSGLYNNPGYTSGEQAGMRYSATAPIASSFAGAEGDVRRHAAVTNNPGAYAGGMGAMARMRGQDLATAGAGVTQKFADARRGDQQAAMGMSQFPIAQRQQLMEGDRSMIPQFQFPASLNADVMGQMFGNQLQNRQITAGVGTNQAGLAYNPAQPGFWGKILQNAAGGAAQGLAMM